MPKEDIRPYNRKGRCLREKLVLVKKSLRD
jgi:hypothetical protein